MVEEAKLCNPINSTFEALIVQQALSWGRIGSILLTNAGCSCSFCASHQFNFAWIQKTVMDQTGRRPPNSDHEPFFGASLALGSALELLCPSTELVIVSCHINSTFCRVSQNRSIVVV